MQNGNLFGKRAVLNIFCIVVAMWYTLQAPLASAQDTDRIVFTSNRDGNREIYTMNPDGTDVQRLTSNTWEDREPAWSPDRSQIAFVSNPADGWDIFVMNADGNTPRRVTPADGSIYDSPSWSPDGQQIVFSSDRNGGLGIFTIGATGGEPQLLTPANPGVENIEPAWSPDGRQIAYASNADGYFDIYLITASGGTPFRITEGGMDHYSPAWSPDGLRIAYALNGNNYSEIYIANSNGSSPDLLVTEESFYADSVTWSPDGSRLVYVVWSNGTNRTIRSAAIDGGSLTQLTEADYESLHANWSFVGESLNSNQLLVVDDFTRNTLDWETNYLAGIASDFVNGNYRFEFSSDATYNTWIVAPGFTDWSYAPILTQDYMMQIDLERATKTSQHFPVILAFNVQQNYSSYITFTIFDRGDWYLVTGNDLLASGQTEAFDFTDGSIYTFGAEIRTTGYKFFVNGQLVAETESYSNINGSVGFGIGIEPTDSGQITAEFDNLLVRILR